MWVWINHFGTLKLYNRGVSFAGDVHFGINIMLCPLICHERVWKYNIERIFNERFVIWIFCDVYANITNKAALMITNLIQRFIDFSWNYTISTFKYKNTFDVCSCDCLYTISLKYLVLKYSGEAPSMDCNKNARKEDLRQNNEYFCEHFSFKRSSAILILTWRIEHFSFHFILKVLWQWRCPRSFKLASHNRF